MTTMGRSLLPGPAEEPEGRVRGERVPVEAWATVAAVLLGLSAGWVASSFPEATHLRLTPLHGAVLGAVVLAACVFLRRPVLGLVALVGLVYLHLSDVLIRHHDLPSLLQFLVLPLLVTIVVEWRRRPLEGLAPWPLTAVLATYALVFFASSAVAEDPALADERAAAAAKGFVLYALVLLLARTPGRVRAGAWTLAAGGLMLGGIGLWQVATGDFGNDVGGLARVEHAQVYGNVLESRLAGPLGDPNFFAQILVMVVPVGLLLAWKERSGWLRAAGFVAAATAAGAVFYTYSRGGALALGAVVLGCLLAARLERRHLLAVAGVLLLGGLVLLSGDPGRRLTTLRQILPGQERVEKLDTSFENRILQAQVAWELFLDHPVLGVGAGNYTEHYYDYADRVGSSASEYERVGGDHYPHDLYLELAAETGFPGLVAFGAVVLLFVGRLRRAGTAYREAGDELSEALASALLIALGAYLVSSLFLHGHYQRYLWVVLGLSAALVREAPTETAGAAARGAPSPARAEAGGGRSRRRAGP